MRVLVTGSNGLLGQKLTRLLDREPGVELVATGRGPSRLTLRRGVYTTLDVTREADIKATLDTHRPEVLIHTAAMTQVDQCETEREECWSQNVTAVDYLAKACEVRGIHLIHLSTDFVFDGSDGPLDETATPHPLSHYGESKLAAERLVQALETPWTIVRTVLVYGVTKDQSRSNIVLWVKNSLEAGKVIRVVNDQWRTPTLAEDLAMGCWLVAQKKATGIYHISGAEMMTPYDIALRTAEHFGLNQGLIRETNSAEFRQPARRPLKTGFIIEKAKKNLGYQPHSFREGLELLGRQIKGVGD
ncbi:MAG: SDR family oxidoreductase [Cyclobacteriaceae bacterium]|nr:SDR family oxidoreductase [Cyclobacteriaceae bacterium]